MNSLIWSVAASSIPLMVHPSSLLVEASANRPLSVHTFPSLKAIYPLLVLRYFSSKAIHYRMVLALATKVVVLAMLPPTVILSAIQLEVALATKSEFQMEILKAIPLVSMSANQWDSLLATMMV